MKLHEIVQDRAFDYKYMYRRMWPFVKPYLFRGILGIMVAIPVGLLDGAVALALKPYMDYVINGKDPHLAQMLAFIIPFAVIAFAVLQGVLKYLNGYLNDWVGFKMSMGMKNQLFGKLLTFESALYDKNSSGLVMSRFLGDADGACAGLILNLKNIVVNITSSMGLVGVLIYNSWKLSFFALIVLGAAFLPVALIRKVVKRVSLEGM
jgi:ATP-binding cassette, subfamily B, bacterial MsbA